MMKVKIFSSEADDNLERAINTWLKDNPTIELVGIEYTAARTAGLNKIASNLFSAMIVYR